MLNIAISPSPGQSCFKGALRRLAAILNTKFHPDPGSNGLNLEATRLLVAAETRLMDERARQRQKGMQRHRA
jgi:hypothetical protein